MLIIHSATPTVQSQQFFATQEEKVKWLEDNDHPFFKEIDTETHPDLKDTDIGIDQDKGRLMFHVEGKEYSFKKFFEKFWY